MAGGSGTALTVTRVVGGPGNDVLWPRNDPAGQDLTLCGAGTDIAYVDRADVIVGCEIVVFDDATEAEFEQYRKNGAFRVASEPLYLPGVPRAPSAIGNCEETGLHHSLSSRISNFREFPFERLFENP